MEYEFLDKENGGPIVLTPTIYNDNRGYFYESFNERDFNKIVPNIHFVQDNESSSDAYVVRGMHLQAPPYAQAKLVRVVNGGVYDIAVDIRKGSPNYGKAYCEYISAFNKKQFFIPEGFAHGFISIAPDTKFQYKCNNYYNKESEMSFCYDYFTGIFDTWKKWQFKLSDKDKNAIKFEDFESPFVFKENC